MCGALTGYVLCFHIVTEYDNGETMRALHKLLKLNAFKPSGNQTILAPAKNEEQSHHEMLQLGP
jgi:hypothetical protein